MAIEKDKQAHSCIDERTDGERQYLLAPKSNDLFMRTGKQIIEACQLNMSVEAWWDEMKAMFDEVRKWIESDPIGTQVVACYAIPRGNSTGLFFVPETDTFNFDLADALADLNVKLARSYKIGVVEVHQVPEAELGRFISGGHPIELYRDAKRPHHSVAS